MFLTSRVRLVTKRCARLAIEEDIAANANMCRKYGEDFFTEGTARLAQTRAEKAQKLAEIEAQLKDTNSSVQQGKQLLADSGTLATRTVRLLLIFRVALGLGRYGSALVERESARAER